MKTMKCLWSVTFFIYILVKSFRTAQWKLSLYSFNTYAKDVTYFFSEFLFLKASFLGYNSYVILLHFYSIEKLIYFIGDIVDYRFFWPVQVISLYCLFLFFSLWFVWGLAYYRSDALFWNYLEQAIHSYFGERLTFHHVCSSLCTFFLNL